MSIVAFSAETLIAQGEAMFVTNEAKAYLATHPTAQILAFDCETSDPVELDLRTNISVFLAEDPPKRPGRPKLGVQPREVTLLARHWEWLNAQPGGASATLRRLVEQARRDPAELRKSAQTAAYKFLSAMLGNAENFEAAARALFADDRRGFSYWSATWPPALREHARALAEKSFTPAPAAAGSA
jgi:uncharacterized protein